MLKCHALPEIINLTASVPLDIAMFNVGCQEVVTPAYVHRLLDRSEWKDRPEVLDVDAINSEKQGLLANGTWDESKIRPKAEVLAEARAKGQKIHVGALMGIVRIKGYEKSPSEWIIKARIVFRGDAARDEANQAAVFDELAASAPTSLGGLNMIIAFWTCQRKHMFNFRLHQSIRPKFS